jgi:hypothetical protein
MNEHVDFTRRIGRDWVWCTACRDWITTAEVVCDPVFGPKHKKHDLIDELCKDVLAQMKDVTRRFYEQQASDN